MTSASAPGKAILCGEHAVVYGRPALAVPIEDVRARATVEPHEADELHLHAPAMEFDGPLQAAAQDQPLRRAIELTLTEIEVETPSLRIEVQSNLPIAAGLGSGAAVSVALIRALSEHFEVPLPPQRQSELAFEVEKLHHGTPSGIDNTVIAYGQPVAFIRGAPPDLLKLGAPFHLLLADSGQSAPTALAVAGVRERRQQDYETYQALFDQVADISVKARAALEQGDTATLGPLLNRNQDCLQQIGVSTPELEALVAAAREAGARGAKLTGAGMGGFMLALVDETAVQEVEQALLRAGATRVLHTRVTP